MQMTESMKPTIIIVLDTRRKKKNETYPIKIRIGYQRMQRYYPTGIDTTKDGFEKIMSATPKKTYLEKRIILDNQMRSVRDAVDQLNNFSFSRLDHFLGQSPKTVNDIFPVFHDVINEKKSLDKVRTAELYELTIKALKKYHPKIGFYDVTPGYLKNLESQMIKDGYSKTTIGMHFRNLRAIYNRAIALKIVRDSSEYPFKKHSYIIPQSRNVKKALTKEEVLNGSSNNGEEQIRKPQVECYMAKLMMRCQKQ